MSQTAGTESATPTSRAGRDLPIAIGVGLVLLALVAGSLLWRKELFFVLVAVVCAVALWELSVAFKRHQITVPLIPMLVGGIGILVSAYLAGAEALLVAFMLTAGGVAIWRAMDGVGAAALRDATAATFATAYVPFLGGFVMLILAAPDGASRAALFVLLSVASDTGGYVAGVLFGRHPLAPTVSPKKSWEGLVGSLLTSMIVGVFAMLYVFNASWTVGVLLGAAAVATATLGDLSESLIKRDLGLKDMGRSLPGHGGVLDRVDSMLLSAPLIYVLMLVLLPEAT